MDSTEHGIIFSNKEGSKKHEQKVHIPVNSTAFLCSFNYWHKKDTGKKKAYREKDDDNMGGGNYIFSACCGGLKINQHMHTHFKGKKRI